MEIRKMPQSILARPTTVTAHEMNRDFAAVHSARLTATAVALQDPAGAGPRYSVLLKCLGAPCLLDAAPFTNAAGCSFSLRLQLGRYLQVGSACSCVDRPISFLVAPRLPGREDILSSPLEVPTKACRVQAVCSPATLSGQTF